MVQKVEDREQPTANTTKTDNIKLHCDIDGRKHSIDIPCEDFYVATDVLAAAVLARDASLAKKSIEVINRQLDKDNALFVLSQATKCKPSSLHLNNYAPSAPPLVEHEDHQEDCLENLIDNLQNNCLLEIDKNADYVLRHKDILNIGYRELLTITTRDSLMVSSESIVYSAVVRWGLEEGRRRGIGSPVQNLKKILGELVYAPRYGCMSKTEFLSRKIENGKCVDKANILTDREMQQIMNHIKKIAKNQQGLDLPHQGSQPRTVGPHSPNLHSTVSNCSSGMSKSACDKHIINFLSCWTAVFD